MIGVTLVLPDGAVAHAGGHVIKNVAGHDLSKMMYGSLGKRRRRRCGSAWNGAAPQELGHHRRGRAWREYAGAHRAQPGQSTAFAGTLPSRLTAVAGALADAADAAGVDVSLASHTALGLHTARFSGPPAQQVSALDRWRREFWPSAAPCCCGSAPPRSTPPSTRSAPHPRPSVCCVPSRPAWIPMAAAPPAASPHGCDRLNPMEFRR